MDLSQAISHARPGAVWSLDGNSLDGLTWISTDSTAPTLAECESAWTEVETARVAETAAKEAARLSARARLTSQGFTDAEIDVMYPTLVAPSAT
jgi:hypothetical protein